MSIKKLFYGVFDAPVFQAFIASVVGTDPTDDSVKKDVAVIDVKAEELKTDVASVDGKVNGIVTNVGNVEAAVGSIAAQVTAVDGKVQTIIDSPGGGTPVDLTPLSNQVAALSLAAGCIFQLMPMAVWVDPLIGVQNDVISVPIMVHLHTVRSFEAFGFEVDFDQAYFQFMGADKGTLTQAWSMVDGNEDIPGHLIVGGLVGNTDDLSEDEVGSIVNLNFTVLGASGTSDIVISKYIDDMKGFQPAQITAQFTHE